VEWANSSDILEVLLRLMAAAAVGSAIGIDRELRGKPAGLRTHAMVSLGAALIMIVTARVAPMGYEHVDAMSRAVQGIIAGVGFLGAGAILKGGSEEHVQGLTTAASIWVVASLGIACGAGQWIASLIAGALTLLILIVGVPVEAFLRRIFGRQPD
jgi:putative Mg2+ transporter-C (MgtC) family protein